MIEPCGRKDSPGKPILYATTDNFLKRFKLKSLADLPDYEELLRRIAEITSISDVSSNYLYEKDVYNPDEDPDLMGDVEESAEDVAENPVDKADGFGLPEHLKDEDDILVIE